MGGRRGFLEDRITASAPFASKSNGPCDRRAATASECRVDGEKHLSGAGFFARRVASAQHSILEAEV